MNTHELSLALQLFELCDITEKGFPSPESQQKQSEEVPKSPAQFGNLTCHLQSVNIVNRDPTYSDTQGKNSSAELGLDLLFQSNPL